MTPGGIFDAYKKDITVWGRKDLKDVLDSNLGDVYKRQVEMSLQ